jgi:predicted esterase
VPNDRWSSTCTDGRYARDASADEVDRQRRLAVRAKGRGFAVLALRGHLGECTAPELADWYCWPSNEHNADTAGAFVGAWAHALDEAHRRTGAARRFLLGFSNGGYFAGLIASRGLLEVEAVVVAHGGPVEPVRAFRRPVPLLLLSADDDIAQDDMIRFDEELTLERWAHDSYARFGGHALTDEDIDAALAFFSRASEPLPLQPPLPMHRAIRHTRDAGLPPDSPDEADASDASVESDEEPSIDPD